MARPVGHSLLIRLVRCGQATRKRARVTLQTSTENKEERVKARIEEAGGAKAVADGITAFHRNMCELDDRTAELRLRFPNRWVALVDGEILTHSGTQLDLLKLVDSEGWDRSVTAIRRMDPNPVKLIL